MDFGGGGGGAGVPPPPLPTTAPESLLLFACFISQFTASMLGSKVQLAPPTVKHNGRANSKIGLFCFHLRVFQRIINTPIVFEAIWLGYIYC